MKAIIKQFDSGRRILHGPAPRNDDLVLRVVLFFGKDQVVAGMLVVDHHLGRLVCLVDMGW